MCHCDKRCILKAQNGGDSQITQVPKKGIFTLTRPSALVAARGFTGMGLSELLKSAAIPKGSFYYCFTSKEDFGGKLLGQYRSQYTERLDEIQSDGTPDARARLMDCWFAGDARKPQARYGLLRKESRGGSWA